MKIKKGVLPLAGLGTRLLPITKSQPKEMLPIYDKPSLHHVLIEAKESGIDNFLFIIGKGKESIEAYFDYSYELEKKLENENKIDLIKKLKEIYEIGKIYYIRQKEPKGLADAVYLAKDFVNNEPFALLLADDIFFYKEPPLLKLIKVFEKFKGIIIGVKRVDYNKVQNYGIIEGDEIEKGLFKAKNLIEKPNKKETSSNLAIIGRYILLPEIFEVIPSLKPGKNNELQLTDAIKNLLGNLDIYGYEIDDIHFDIGNKVDYLVSNIYFSLMDDEIKDELINKIKNLIKGI
ncbi:MAG: UTP--glucose-1-phosphate uridylyltransferase [Caldisericia bacterium]|nr:UTP--glucose-1-phosphate uridylyltransferase [Caldisericia bacterium]